ncbi:hypothetical protein EDB81DRAFT_788819 [Dactylonectria macrodidyma]|uniref:Uncharacterized protein n=1 Tax=Dactylonectria macrodidyma TaxID=307937 RepID=A0A9P9FAY3_9HYPO|nr:hypothetical protein EDB81DRAFT_788819 [Dactylonectria macrodidyma]
MVKPVETDHDEPTSSTKRKQKASAPAQLCMGETGFTRVPRLRPLAAISFTFLLNTLPSHIGAGSGCWKAISTCNHGTLYSSILTPPTLARSYNCEALLLVVAASTFLHWMCVFGLFQQPRWAERYREVALYTTTSCLIAAAFIVGDLVTVITQILPAIFDVCVVFCVFAELLSVEDQSSR